MDKSNDFWYQMDLNSIFKDTVLFFKSFSLISI